MITLHTFMTPNGRKASIMLEEVGAEYTVKLVDISKNEQFSPDYLKISPNNKIPAIVDDEPLDGPRILFETGAILIYLAEKSGRLLAKSGPRRDEALEWLFWSSAGLGPMFGQWAYFAMRAKEKVPAAIERFTDEAVRLVNVMEKRLQEAGYFAGEYSIADIGAFTWARAIVPELKKQASEKLGPTPATDRWLAAIEARPAVMRGLEVPKL